MFSLDTAFGAVVLVLVLGALWLALRLFHNVRPISAEDRDRTRRLTRLEEQKDALGEELRTAELDCRLGRISLEDFRAERARIEPDLVRVLAELDSLAVDDDIEEPAR